MEIASENPNGVDLKDGLLTTTLATAAPLNALGKVIKKAKTCSYCGKQLDHMPTIGYCSSSCFAKAMKEELMSHINA